MEKLEGFNIFVPNLFFSNILYSPHINRLRYLRLVTHRNSHKLVLCKETFGDPGEVLRIKRLDVDTNNKQISLRYPVKNHLPRTPNVSNRLLVMIEALPRKDDRVFPIT
jgi:hypothetical protein